MHTKNFSLLFLILGILCALLFLPPFFKSIINPGNLTGMGIAILLISYGLLFSHINHIIVMLWKTHTGKFLLSLALLLLTVILLLTAMITSCMIKAAQNEPSKNIPAIVLGCAVHGTQPSLMLQRRLDAALNYLKEHPSTSAILSGGKGPGEDITEAQCMFNYLIEHGISRDRLYLEDRSENTMENIQYSKEILREFSEGEDIAIITNEFHQYRAGLLAKTVGLNPYSINGRTVFYLLPTYYIRELYAVLKEWIL